MQLSCVGSLPVGRKRIDNDWNKCLFCQSINEESIREASQSGFLHFKTAFSLRKKFNDVSSQNLIDRLDSNNLDQMGKSAKWHANCYASFTSISNIKRIENRFQQIESIGNVKLENDICQDGSLRLLRKTIGVMNINLCIVCQKRKKVNKKEEKIIQVQSKSVADQISNITRKNSVIHCRLGTADPIAACIKYHHSCLQHQLFLMEKSEKHVKKSIYDIAFQQLLKQTDLGFAIGNVFTLRTLCDLYNRVLASMDVTHPQYPAKLVLKRLVEHYGDKIDTVTQFHRNESTLIFPKVSVGVAVKAFGQACQETTDKEVMGCLSEEEFGDDFQLLNRMIYHVAEKIKSDLGSTKGLHNITDITKEAAIKVVPDSLKLLLSLVLNGNGNNSLQNENKVLNIGQDVVFANNPRKLTPKHVGLGLAIHQATRSKMLVDQVHAAGDCVSYETIMRIDTSLANHILQHFQNNDNVYIPENLQINKFVHFATDNIDIIEETLDGTGTFHATQIVAFQRGPPKKICDTVTLKHDKVLNNIPREFLEVKQGPELSNPTLKTSPINETTLSNICKKQSIHNRDLTWLVLRSSKSDQIIPSWTDANKLLSEKSHQITTIGYTPILPQPAHETGTLLTVLKRCQDISKALGQKYTVISCDEALYCKLKQLQWQYNSFDEVIVRLGGFHWVYNFIRVIGQHFANSGLADAWIETGVYGETTALNIIEGKQYNRCIRAIKLTFDALWRVLICKMKQWANETNQLPIEYIALVESFNDSFTPNLELISKWKVLELKADELFDLVAKHDSHNESNELFKFWRSFLDLAGLVLKFIRAEREGDWSLHLEAVTQMIPWFFVYDHTNYARWGTIYLMDMQALPKTAEEIYIEFMNGNFVVKGTPRPFNEKSPDQALEHVNKVHKIAGGLIGITKIDSARDRWCATFNYRSQLSEMARKLLGTQREDIYEETVSPSDFAKDERDVLKLVDFFQKKELFGYNNAKLINIYTGEVASSEITNDLLNAQSRGLQLAEEFVNSRLVEKSVDFYSPLKKVKSKTFKHLHTLQAQAKKTIKTVSIETNILVRQMFSAVKNGREIDLKKILQSELREPPPSLFDGNGEMRHTAKAVLSNLLQKDQETIKSLDNEPKVKTACLIDGQALIQAIGKPKGARNFGDLSDAFLLAIKSNFKHNDCESIHVLFDRYNKASIKSGTRSKRSQSTIPIEYQISSRETILPRKWDRFIHSIENKANLNEFLSKEIAKQASQLDPNYELLTSGGFTDPEIVRSNISRNIDHLQSNHEEADTRFILHGIDCNLDGFERVIVHSRDTDVLLLLIHFYEKLPSFVWMKVGTSKHPKYVPVHDLARSMQPDVQKALLSYHAITGCDSTSALSGHSKKSSWPVFIKHAHLLNDFGQFPILDDMLIEQIEKFIVQIYINKRTVYKDITNIDDLRAAMFQQVRELDKLPPTKEVLSLHLQRANYQALCWHTADTAMQSLPQPVDCGWKMQDDHLIPVTSSKVPITLKDLALISCGCKSGCGSSRCGCANRKQKCMKDVCHIGVQCSNQYNCE